jgi:hypothetical protein
MKRQTHKEGSMKRKDKIMDINEIHAIEEKLLEQYDVKAYHELLCGKFIDFVKDKEILDSFVRGCTDFLDPVSAYSLVMFGGLIVVCFELPMFKRKTPGDNKEAEMMQYMKDFMANSLFLITKLRMAIAFADDSVKQRYEDFIRQNDLLPEIEPDYEDIYGVLAHYSSRQPVLRDYIAELVFTSPLECPTENKILLFTHLYFIIEFLNEYYVDSISP